MPIFVKAHRRGNSSVAAYIRASSALKRVEKRAYRPHKKTINMDRMNQYYATIRKLEKIKTKAEGVVRGKFDTGASLMGGRRNAGRSFTGMRFNQRRSR